MPKAASSCAMLIKKTLAELLEGVFAAPEQEKTFASLFKRLTKDETKQKK